MLRTVRGLLVAAVTGGGLVLSGAALSPAAACGGGAVGGSCPPEVSGGTVTVTVTGSFVRAGSSGSSGGSTTVAVQVPCFLWKSWTGKEYYDGIQDGTITGAGWDEWADRPWTPYPGYQKHKDDTEGHWYTPGCSMTDQFEDFDDFDSFAQEYFLTYPHTYVEAGETPPVPPVPPEILLAAAQEAMEVPQPAFEHNPDVAGAFDTLVNFDTWFWLEDPTQTGSVTATAGANSVSVDAELEDVRFSASGTPGSVQCDGTGVPYAPGATSSCTMRFARAGDIDVTAQTLWGATWSYNGQPQGALDEPLRGDFTDTVGVAQSQTLVTGVG